MLRFKSLVAPLMALCALLILPVSAGAEVLDRIVAVVNNGVVLQSELDGAIHDAVRQIKSRGIAAPDDSELRAQVLDRLILTRIQTQRAQQAGVRIDDRELNEVLGNIAKQNNMTVAEFTKMVQSDGMDIQNLREQLRDEVLISRLKQHEVDSRLVVTDQDIDLYLANQGDEDDTEYRLSHILVAIPDAASAEERAKRRAKADDVLRKLRKGGDFAQLAISQSDGQQALQGGDLDWRKGGDLPALFATAAAKLKQDQVSDILETTSGYHILKLTGVRGGTPRQSVVEAHSQHILLQNTALRDEDQSRVQARDLYDRIKKGEDFDKLAKEFSDDPGSKNSGGDLGWQPPGTFVPEFQLRLDQMQPGEVSTPFRSQFGWHVVKLLERRTRDTTEESRRARARQAIMQRKSAEEYDVWLRRLRAEAYVEYRLSSDAKAS